MRIQFEFYSFSLSLLLCLSHVLSRCLSVSLSDTFCISQFVVLLRVRPRLGGTRVCSALSRAREWEREGQRELRSLRYICHSVWRQSTNKFRRVRCQLRSQILFASWAEYVNVSGRFYGQAIWWAAESTSNTTTTKTTTLPKQTPQKHPQIETETKTQIQTEPLVLWQFNAFVQSIFPASSRVIYPPLPCVKWSSG